MIMYGVYNSDTLTDLIDTVHRIQKLYHLEWKDFCWKLTWLDGDIFSRWRHAQLCHKFCTIFDYHKRKICENVWKIYQGPKIIFQDNKSFIKRVSTHFPIASIKTRENPERSKNSNCKIQQRLWLSFNKTLPILRHEISDMWNRQPKEFDCTISCICATLHPEKIDYVSNWNSSSPYLNENEQAHSYTELKIEKPYIALNKEMYIMLRTQELNMCKKIGYEYYCKELFVVKSKTRYSYASAIYFNLEPDVIKANCEFQYYYNKTDIQVGPA